MTLELSDIDATTGIIGEDFDWGKFINKKEHDKKFVRVCREGRLEDAKQMLESGADVNARDEWERTALLYSLWHRHSNLTKMLIEAGADVNAKSHHLGYTPLISASSRDDIELCLLLISHGADLMAKNFFNRTALDEIGRSREFYSIDHPSLAPLAEADKAERRKLMIDEYTNVHRKRNNWARRLPFLHFLVGCGYSKIRLTSEQLLIDTSSRIEPVDISSSSKYQEYLMSCVFSNSPLARSIVQFL